MRKLLLSLSMIALVCSASYGQNYKQGLLANYLFKGSLADAQDMYSSAKKTKGVTLAEDRFGNANYAFYIPDSNYISITDDSTLKNNEMAISIWVKIEGEATSTFSSNSIVSMPNNKTGGYFDGFALYGNPKRNGFVGVTSLQGVNIERVVEGNKGIDSSKWHHLVLSMDADSIRLYENGILRGNKNKSFVTKFAKDSIWIGTSGNSNISFFNGYVSDFKIYNRALTQTDVDSLFNEPNPNPVSSIQKMGQKVSTIKLYPNPSNDIVNLSINADVVVTNLMGAVLFQVTNTNRLSLGNLSNGVYFVTLTERNGATLQTKLIKN